MCMLTFFQPGVMPHRQRLMNGTISNRDGHGFAIVVEGENPRLEVGHSMNASAAVSAFMKARERHPESYAIFHSRFTTDGVTNLDNCHPFHVGGDSRTVIAHNGILPVECRPGKGEQRSDTRLLAEDVLPEEPFGSFKFRRARRRFSRWLLSENYPNKVALLTVDPRYPRRAYLFNAHKGEWKDGVWYSNNGYCDWRDRYGSSAGYHWTYGSGSNYRSVFTTIGGTSGTHGTVATSTSGTSEMTEQELWALYRNGDITWAEYLDLGFGADTRRGDGYGDCRLCKRSNVVSLAVGYCTACLKCVDCGARTQDCQCFVPGDSSRTWSDYTRDSSDDGEEGASAAQDTATSLEKVTEEVAGVVARRMFPASAGYEVNGNGTITPHPAQG